MKTKILFALVLVFGFLGCQTDAVDNNQTPSAAHYNISDNFSQTLGNTTPIEVTRKEGSSPGAITVNYRGIQGTEYTKSQTFPGIAGVFHVTFDVAAADGWNAAIDLNAGNLSINSGSSGEELYEIAFTQLVNVMIATQMDMMLDLLPMLTMLPGIEEILPPGITIEDLEDITSLEEEVIAEIISSLVFFMLDDWDSLITIIAMLGVHGDIVEGADLTTLLDLADVSLFHDADGSEPIVGSDKITPTTVVYSTVPFELIQSVLMGGIRYIFTIGELLDEIGFTGTIVYPLPFGEFIETVSSVEGETVENLSDQGVTFYTESGAMTLNSLSSITGRDMVISCSWPVDDAASMF